MNFLPSMLIATTLIGGSGSIKVDLSSVDMNSLQNQCNGNYVGGQIFSGSISELETFLKNCGVDIDLIIDCLPPSAPDTKPVMPDTETPDAKPDAPGTDAPDTAPDAPGTDTPDTKPDAPGTDTPDTAPDAPGTGIPAPGPDTSAPGNGSNDIEEDATLSYVKQVVSLVNAERAKYGLPALTMSLELNNAAQIRAREIVQSFSHTRPNGSSFSSVLKENGIAYRSAGENIAWGQRTPEAVVNAWMNSEGHRANILNKNYTAIGIGYYLNGSTPYWAQLFTS